MTSTPGLIPFSFAVYGLGYRELPLIEGIMLCISTSILFYPAAWINFIGVILILFVFLNQKGGKKSLIYPKRI
jgi:TRAP-type uncharacterized transport system fused permease subunit